MEKIKPIYFMEIANVKMLVVKILGTTIALSWPKIQYFLKREE